MNHNIKMSKNISRNMMQLLARRLTQQSKSTRLNHSARLNHTAAAARVEPAYSVSSAPVAPAHGPGRRSFSSSIPDPFNLFTPSEEHENLRQIVRSFVAEHVEPQATEFNRAEKFNIDLFRRLGSELGILGCSVSEEYGGAGFDAVASCIIHEELAYSDPAFCLSYLAHSCLFVNNLHHILAF